MTSHTWRRLLMLLTASSLVAVYLVWWVGYATAHQDTRYRALPAGAPATVQGTTVRLEQLTRTARLADQIGDRTVAPVPGALWVVARLQIVQHQPGPTWTSSFLLLATTGATWQSTYPPVSRTLGAYDSSKPAPQEFEQVYEVPATMASRLAGIAIEDSTSPARGPVLRPPG